MADTVAAAGEFAVIGRLRRVVAQEGIAAPGGTLGIGDDAAVLRVREGCELLVTCDALMERKMTLLKWEVEVAICIQEERYSHLP